MPAQDNQQLAKEMKELVMGAVTLWRSKDFAELDKYLKLHVYTSTTLEYNKRVYQFVTMLLECIKYLETLLAEELNQPVEEIHARLALLIAAGDV